MKAWLKEIFPNDPCDDLKVVKALCQIIAGYRLRLSVEFSGRAKTLEITYLHPWAPGARAALTAIGDAEAGKGGTPGGWAQMERDDPTIAEMLAVVRAQRNFAVASPQIIGRGRRWRGA